MLAQTLKFKVFRSGNVRRIGAGPLRGYRFRLDPVTDRTAWRPAAERPQQAFMTSHIQRGDTTIDVGASWGVDSLLMARSVCRAGRVIAIEPCPIARESLRWHVGRNRCRQVYVVPGAASDFDGTRSGQIEVYQLDTLWRRAGRPHVGFIKVDVDDGDEVAIIRGARGILDRDRPALLICVSAPDNGVAEFALDLMRREYRVWRLQHSGDFCAVPAERIAAQA